MLNVKTSIAFAVTITALSVAACTQTPAESAVASAWPSFEQIDADANGTLDRQEAALVANLNFAAADMDYDGKLSKAEYEVAMKIARR